MQNFIKLCILSLSLIATTQEFDENGLELFIKKYKQEQEAKKKDGLSNFLVEKFKEYSQDDKINYNDYTE
jgi:hypothetical protein